MKFPTKYGDFSALDDLASILRMEPHTIGVFTGTSEEEGPYVTVASPSYERTFKFLIQDDGNFILQIAKIK